jgi:hypothetical protein
VARQRSGSSSSRNSRGPRGARPASTRPAAKGPPAAAVAPEAAVEPPVVEPVAEPAEEAAPVAKKSVRKKPAVPVPVDPEPVAVEPADPEPADAAADDFIDDADLVDEVDIDPVEAEVEADEADEAELDTDDDDATERAAAAAALWSEVRMAPVEIALPRGVGYTLRAYRMSDEVAAVEVDEREDEFAGFLGGAAGDDDPDAAEEDLVAALGLEAGPVVRTKPKNRDDDLDFDEDDDDDLDPDAVEDDELEDELDDEDDEDDEDEPVASDDSDSDDDDEKVAVKPAAEEVPLFLGRRGKVYLFTSPEQLVEFVRTSEEHDLAQLDTWADLRGRLTADDIVPDPADKYELDLVVDNLRGGADSLDYGLLIQAGELARDLAFATRLEPVITALGPGTPLDDLDEAVRTADGSGGIRGFLAKRKLRKIVTQQTALGWRTIISKISSVVDWRE